MARRYSFLILFLAVLAPLAWWSDQVRGFQAPAGLSTAGDLALENTRRLELLEVLDRLVAYQHYYRSVYGHYTQRLSRLGYAIPEQVAEAYDVRIASASRSRLMITAFSEIQGRVRDRITIDQDYQIQANFVVPEPRVEHLRTVALRHLRASREAPSGRPLDSITEDRGLFKGYFRYELGMAIGVKAPVLGMRIDLEADSPEVAEGAKTGQKPVASVMSTLEEAYLAQKIFRGEMGRYARNWSELSKIASFRFEDKAQWGQDSPVPFGDESGVTEVDANGLNALRESQRTPSSEVQPLEIEEISEGAN
jgi:hypothetical protein